MKIGNNVRAILAVSNVRGPSTRKELLAGFYPAGVSDRWMHSPFTSGYSGNGHECSLLHRGLLEVVGKRGNARVFAITPKGKALIGA